MTTSILSVRVSEAERSLLEMAAKHAHTNLSDFIRKKALESAELEILKRSVVEIPDERWGQFEAWLETPAQKIPAITDLLSTKPVWE